MTEIELKFQVPAQARQRVAAAVAGRGAAPRVQRLQAAYFDTDDARLAQAGVALRLRREGRRWVQTLKADGDDALTRLEHNVERPARGATPPAPDLSLHAGTPAGERLAAVLAGHPGAVLSCRYRTDIRRTCRTLRSHGARLELAFDEGRIVAGERTLPVCELEIELLGGEVAGLLATAREWVSRHGLWLDTRSKAERGTLLAAGLTRAAARKASRVALPERIGRAAARRAVLAECLRHAAANASQVASGDFGAEHVHQWRVALRRLRSALRLFEDDPAGPLAGPAASLFRALGAARDEAAIGGPLRERLARAIAALGLPWSPPAWPGRDAGDPAQVARSPHGQALLLALIETSLPAAPAAADEPAAAPLRRRLARWHRRVVEGARRFDVLDDEARHRLRKRVKRLRYGVEFARDLLAGRRTADYLAALAELQERLGSFNDASVAIDAWRGAPADEPAVAFALGWLSARREGLVAEVRTAAEDFAAAPHPWKR